MLVVNKNLKPKDISGKKYRSPIFSLSAIFSVPFLIAATVTSLVIPPREGRGAIIVLIFVIFLAIPVAVLISFRETSYIIAKDRLCFFSSQVTYLKNENRKKTRCVRTNGSIEYSDIKDFRYIGVIFEGYYPSNKRIVPPRVVIIGDDFEIEIYAYKGLIKKIRELSQAKSGSI
jgi:hypothetical protein